MYVRLVYARTIRQSTTRAAAARGRAAGRRPAPRGLARAAPRAPAGDFPLTFHTDPSVASHLAGAPRAAVACARCGRRLRVVLLVGVIF